MIDPTVRHAIRISSVTADLEHWVASQATCSSKTYVSPAPCLAHGTAATTTPCSGQSTRGAAASSQTGIVPRSSPRQRLGPGHSRGTADHTVRSAWRHAASPDMRNQDLLSLVELDAPSTTAL